MIKKMFFTTALLLVVLGQAFSQYQADALFYSEQTYGSTSKSLAMGGALSAVGADLSVMTTNPAGLALLKNSHFTFTSNFILNNAEAKYTDNVQLENSFGYSVKNLGFAWAHRNESSDWKSFSFGLTYNRIGEYRQDVIASGNNHTGSILDYYVYNANDDGRISVFREDLAYETYLLEYDADQEEYYSFVTDDGTYGERQRRSQYSTGGKGEFDISFAANYNDIVSFGATLGTQFINHNRDMDFSESGYADILRPSVTGEGMINVAPKEMIYDENWTVSGMGVNVKAGVLVQPVPFFRLSAAVHSKTLTGFNEEFNSNISATFIEPDENNNRDYHAGSEYNYFDWNLHQPMRFNGGMAFVLDQYQIGSFYTVPMTLSFEYEYVDYSTMHLKSVNADFDKENKLIREMYKETHNLRSGLELNFGKIRLRGGYALYPSAYAADESITDNARMVYSGGISFAGKAGYIDVSYSLSNASSTLYMYDANIYYPTDPMGSKAEPTAWVNNKYQYITLAFGLR